MNCPKCNINTHTHQFDGVEINECTKCYGVWFDKDELRKCKDLDDPDLNWMDFELWKIQDQFQVSTNPVICPKCQVNMAAIKYDKTNIQIDYCPHCQSVWLDKDEFQGIIKQLNEELLTKSFSEYIKASLEEAKEIFTGPEGFISEWRDFLAVLKFMQLRLLAENPKLTEKLITFQKNNPIR